MARTITTFSTTAPAHGVNESGIRRTAAGSFRTPVCEPAYGVPAGNRHIVEHTGDVRPLSIAAVWERFDVRHLTRSTRRAVSTLIEIETADQRQYRACLRVKRNQRGLSGTCAIPVVIHLTNPDLLAVADDIR